MNVLLNGCSFMDNHHYRDHFKELLGATSVVNIAKPGSSNRRIIRTTVDYCEMHKPDLVVLGLTFYDRQEGPFVTIPKPREGHWVSYNSQGFQGTFVGVDDFDSTVEHKMVDDYVKERYRYDINVHYLEQLYLDLRMLASYLREQQIGFCIFNTCDRHHTKIDLGPEFIPFDFIGNEFLEQNGCKYFENDADLPANARHHYGEDVILLVAHIVEHIQKNKSIDNRI
jgi:hypothetical protein